MRKVNGAPGTCRTPPSRQTVGSQDREGSRVFEDIMTGNFPNLMKDMNVNIQEAQKTPRGNQRGPH